MPEKEEAQINMLDERKQYIRAKSGQIAYQIMTFVLLGISLFYSYGISSKSLDYRHVV